MKTEIASHTFLKKAAVIARLLVALFVASAYAEKPEQRNGWIMQPVFDSMEANLLKSFPSASRKDSMDCLRYMDEILSALRKKGHIAAAVDSVHRSGDTMIVRIHPDRKFGPVHITQGNVPEELIDGALRSQLAKQEPLSTRRISNVLENVLKNCEENGYPFARVRLDSIKLHDGDFFAILNLDRGRMVQIDSIRINGEQAVAPAFIYNYLGISPGNLYDESKITAISVRLKELPFIKEVRPASVLFTDKYTRLDLYIERRKSSQFDGVIGLLPDDSGAGKPKLTGEVHLKLQNSFRRGESLNFDWRQLPPRSQDLNVAVRYPFLFKSPLGVEGMLNLYRRDTLFVDVVKQAGIFVALKGSDYAKLFLKNKQSDLQYTAGLDQLTTLPEYADITTNEYGVQFHYERLDYRLNPRRGIQADMTGSVGSRTIRQNSSINPEVYDSLQLQTIQFAGDLWVKLFLPLYDRHVLAVMSRSAFIQNPNIFDNEMYRIGGLRSLRGFDEESIFATAYSIANIEYRYLTDINSFLFAFVNGAWYEKKSSTDFRSGTPLGFGVGMNVETRLGILSISYALGKQEGRPIELRSGKVHFGIVNYF